MRELVPLIFDENVECDELLTASPIFSQLCTGSATLEDILPDLKLLFSNPSRISDFVPASDILTQCMLQASDNDITPEFVTVLLHACLRMLSFSYSQRLPVLESLSAGISHFSEIAAPFTECEEGLPPLVIASGHGGEYFMAAVKGAPRPSLLALGRLLGSFCVFLSTNDSDSSVPQHSFIVSLLSQLLSDNTSRLCLILEGATLVTGPAEEAGSVTLLSCLAHSVGDREKQYSALLLELPDELKCFGCALASLRPPLARAHPAWTVMAALPFSLEQRLQFISARSLDARSTVAALKALKLMVLDVSKSVSLPILLSYIVTALDVAVPTVQDPSVAPRSIPVQVGTARFQFCESALSISGPPSAAYSRWRSSISDARTAGLSGQTIDSLNSAGFSDLQLDSISAELVPQAEALVRHRALYSFSLALHTIVSDAASVISALPPSREVLRVGLPSAAFSLLINPIVEPPYEQWLLFGSPRGALALAILDRLRPQPEHSLSREFLRLGACGPDIIPWFSAQQITITQTEASAYAEALYQLSQAALRPWRSGDLESDTRWPSAAAIACAVLLTSFTRKRIPTLLHEASSWASCPCSMYGQALSHLFVALRPDRRLCAEVALTLLDQGAPLQAATVVDAELAAGLITSLAHRASVSASTIEEMATAISFAVSVAPKVADYLSQKIERSVTDPGGLASGERAAVMRKIKHESLQLLLEQSPYAQLELIAPPSLRIFLALLIHGGDLPGDLPLSVPFIRAAQALQPQLLHQCLQHLVDAVLNSCPLSPDLEHFLVGCIFDHLLPMTPRVVAVLRTLNDREPCAGYVLSTLLTTIAGGQQAATTLLQSAEAYQEALTSAAELSNGA